MKNYWNKKIKINIWDYKTYIALLKCYLYFVAVKQIHKLNQACAHFGEVLNHWFFYTVVFNCIFSCVKMAENSVNSWSSTELTTRTGGGLNCITSNYHSRPHLTNGFCGLCSVQIPLTFYRLHNTTQPSTLERHRERHPGLNHWRLWN